MPFISLDEAADSTSINQSSQVVFARSYNRIESVPTSVHFKGVSPVQNILGYRIEAGRSHPTPEFAREFEYLQRGTHFAHVYIPIPGDIAVGAQGAKTYELHLFKELIEGSPTGYGQGYQKIIRWIVEDDQPTDDECATGRVYSVSAYMDMTLHLSQPQLRDLKVALACHLTGFSHTVLLDVPTPSGVPVRSVPFTFSGAKDSSGNGDIRWFEQTSPYEGNPPERTTAGFRFDPSSYPVRKTLMESQPGEMWHLYEGTFSWYAKVSRPDRE